MAKDVKHAELVAQIKGKYEKMGKLIDELDRAVQMKAHQFHLFKDPVESIARYYLIRLSDNEILKYDSFGNVQKFINGWRQIPHEEILNESGIELRVREL
jgi:hypothetical protein